MRDPGVVPDRGRSADDDELNAIVGDAVRNCEDLHLFGDVRVGGLEISRLIGQNIGVCNTSIAIAIVDCDRDLVMSTCKLIGEVNFGVKSSGFEELDKAALNSLKAVSRFPAFPSQLGPEPRAFVVSLSFTID